MKYILTIAGSDSIGGAGIQADIKTITSLGGHALTVVTALTAQNSLGIASVYPVPAAAVCRQFEAITVDIVPDAVKVGMLFAAPTIRKVAELIGKCKISRVVLDPVVKSSTGGALLTREGLKALKELLLPLAAVVTPNLHEAEILSGIKVRCLEEMQEACKRINAYGPAVVIKGGHLEGDCVDLLYDGRQVYRFRGKRIPAFHTHGTGCVFSSALATFLAKGDGLAKATKEAHDFVRQAIRRGYACGKGAGAVNPALIPRDKAHARQPLSRLARDHGNR